MASTKSPHILSTSSNLLGFCLIVMTSLRIADHTEAGILDEVTGVQVQDQGTRPSGINTFTIEGRDLQALFLKLRTQGINTSVTNFDWAWLDLQARGIESIMHASLHYYNTEEEVERFMETIANAWARP